MAFGDNEIPQVGGETAEVVAKLEQVVRNTGTTAQNTQDLSEISDSLSSIDSHASEIETAVELIDDVVYADDADFTAGTSKIAVIGGVRTDSPATVTDGDVGPIRIDANRQVMESNSGSIKTAVEIIDNCISGSEAQVDVVAALPAGTNNIGDVDVASIAAGTNIIGKVGIDQTTDGTTNKVAAAAYNGITLTYRSIKQDGYTEALQTIDYSHHEIHAGNHFFYSDYDADVDTAGPKYYRITTPNTTKWSHVTFTLYSEGVGSWQLFENPTVNAAGTTATVFNCDRNSATAATLVIAYDATSTADGTLLKTWRTGSGTTTPTRIGTDARGEVEIILKQNEDYFLKFTPDADNAKTKVEVDWYEHTNLAP